MADKVLAGGGENTRIYLLKSDHSGIVQADGTTAATTNAHALISLTTGIIKPSFKIDKITLELAKHDAALLAFIKERVAPFSSADVDGEVLYGEKGTKLDVDAGASTGIDQLLIVYRGGTNADGINTLAAVCTLDGTARNFEAEYKKHSKRILEFTPIAAQAAIAVANGLLPTPAGYNASATLTIAAGEPWEQAFLTPA